MSVRGCLGAVVALALLALAAACDVTPEYLKEQARRERLAAVGVAGFDTAGAYRLAGMSTRREIDLVPLGPGELAGDTLGVGYRTFRTRCASCHDAPSPGSQPAYMWEAIMSRMKKNAADAGLMPISAEDDTIVFGFLRKHASDRR